MDWAKAKTILIFILIGVNAILAGILGYRYWETASAKAEELSEALAVLENAGYELVPEQLPDVSAPVLDLLRDADAERAAAEFLFGSPAEAQPLSEGGASIRYVCPLGEAVFRTGGSFELVPYESLETGELTAALSGWLRGMGFWSGDGYPDIILTDGGGAVRVRRGGFPSWEEEAVAAVSDGKAVSISGHWQLGEARQSPSAGVSNSAHWALLSLADYLGASGEKPGKLVEMELGYGLEVLSPNITRFIPRWRVILESGGYYVNALTGEAEAIPLFS